MPHIGNYEFDEIIGRGRFGRVYKGSIIPLVNM